MTDRFADERGFNPADFVRRRLGVLQYAVRQGRKIGWFGAHYALSQKQAGPGNSRKLERERKTDVIGPTDDIGWETLSKGVVDLLRKDARDVRKGTYLPPEQENISVRRALRDSFRYFREVRRVNRRRAQDAHSEVLTKDRLGRYPRYYLQNFHYQSDGYLSKRSAEIYDYQVEVLFAGMADAMRRRCLPPVMDAAPQSGSVLDVACGTGRFLKELHRNRPDLVLSGLDLSDPYLAKAEQTCPQADLTEGNAEALPYPDNSMDVVISIYLFHELPPKARLASLREMARVLKPGGRLVLGDSLQFGDWPAVDRVLELFPHAFHEPFYKSWIALDLNALFDEVGLTITGNDTGYLTKVAWADKP